MYAPKFRSWMTDWERFDEVLNHRMETMAAEAIAEIHGMANKARAEISTPIEEMWASNNAYLHGLLQHQYFPTAAQMASQMAHAQNSYCQPGAGLYGSLGSAFGLFAHSN